MTRRNFSKATQVARFKQCGGLCEGILESGTRCGVVLVAGRWHCDHRNPAGLSGPPTLENAQCLCIPCHKRKTPGDIANIARAKRIEAKDIGAELPKVEIKSRGFQQSGKTARIEKTPLAPRALYRTLREGEKPK